MQQIISITLSALLICCTCTNAIPRDASTMLSKGVADIPSGVSPVIGAQARVYPCPGAADIAPCVCTVDGSNLYMDCSAISSNEELNAVFLNDFPVPAFYEFRIDDNPFLTQLQFYCFGNVTFQRIILQYTNINYVSP